MYNQIFGEAISLEASPETQGLPLKIEISGSLGGVIYDPLSSLEDAINGADQTMYKIKKSGGSGAQVKR